MAIRTTGLTRRYGETTVLDGLDRRVEAGTVHGLLGPNGAGKTTTVRILSTDRSRPSSTVVSPYLRVSPVVLIAMRPPEG